MKKLIGTAMLAALLATSAKAEVASNAASIAVPINFFIRKNLLIFLRTGKKPRPFT